MKKLFFLFNLLSITYLPAFDKSKTSKIDFPISQVCRWDGCTNPTQWSSLFKLRDHIHTNHYPKEYTIFGFKCEWDNCPCTTSFILHSLFRHLEGTTHLNIKRFRCQAEGCDAAYGQKGHLTHHIKESHANKPEFKCPVSGCICNYTRKSSLTKHIKNLHPENFFPEVADLPPDLSAIPNLEPKEINSEKLATFASIAPTTTDSGSEEAVTKPSKKPRTTE